MTSPDYAHHFSSRNIPFGIASSKENDKPQVATRIENTVLLLHSLYLDGFFSEVEGLAGDVVSQSTVNKLAALSKDVHRGIRKSIGDAFDKGGLNAFPRQSRVDVSEATMHLPIEVRDFIDFSCSLEHVKNAGRIITNNANPPPAFFNFPVGYQGRASSVVVSGAGIERPVGQYRNTDTGGIIVGPSEKVDYELEFAAIVGKPLPMGKRLLATEADEHIFGFALLNDWSARDIQGFEMSPLGPLNGKNFGTSLSPWIVTLDALEPFRTKGPPREIPVTPYLEDPENATYSVRVQVEIESGGISTVIGRSDVEGMYWTARQMLAHAVSAGGALSTGDIMATGTVSGTGQGTHGCLLETTEGGRVPVKLGDGTERRYLEDRDVVRMTGLAGPDGSGVGFGECVGKLLPARPFPK